MAGFDGPIYGGYGYPVGSYSYGYTPQNTPVYSSGGGYNPTTVGMPGYSQNSVGGNQTPGNIPGRLVDSPDEIAPKEVPMDGSLGVFPLRDGSGIITKSWMSDGTIRTTRFVKEEQASAKADPYNDILIRLERLEKQMNNKFNKQKVYRRNNQEQTDEVEYE